MKGYYVSNYGRILSFARGKGKLLHPCCTAAGYKAVGLAKKSKEIKQKYVHRLVAQTFIDADIKGKEIHHINHKEADNRAINLIPLPVDKDTHYKMDRINDFGLLKKKNVMKKHPLDLCEELGMTIDELMSYVDTNAKPNYKKWRIEDINGVKVGFVFREYEKKRHMGRRILKK